MYKQMTFGYCMFVVQAYFQVPVNVLPMADFQCMMLMGGEL
jgi:hypothetical protein